jgi:hypothetical protein
VWSYALWGGGGGEKKGNDVYKRAYKHFLPPSPSLFLTYFDEHVAHHHRVLLLLLDGACQAVLAAIVLVHTKDLCDERGKNASQSEK